MTYVWVRAIAVALLLWSVRGPAVYGADAGDPSARPALRAADSLLTYAGARGFCLLGGYNARFLAMVAVHHLTENVYNSMGLPRGPGADRPRPRAAG